MRYGRFALALAVLAWWTRTTLLGTGVWAEILFMLFFFGALMNTSLAFFNLIPLPPLDGFGVLMGVLAALQRPWAYREPVLRLVAAMNTLVWAALPVGGFHRSQNKQWRCNLGK